MQRAPDLEEVWITDSFIGTAHALRRDIFLKLGGYREDLIHQGEESDYCIRLLEAGFCVRLGNADPVCHFESPRRDFRRMDFFGGRNNILFAWYNVPWPHLPLHLAATTINGFRTGLRNRRLLRKVYGIAAGYRDCLVSFQKRSPVSVPVYRLSRRLKKRGPATLQSAEALLASRPLPLSG
jgi:GT2 family glycosyltransferase